MLRLNAPCDGHIKGDRGVANCEQREALSRRARELAENERFALCSSSGERLLGSDALMLRSKNIRKGGNAAQMR